MRDFALYFAIALVIGTAAIALAHTNMSHDAFIRWGGLLVNTALLFGYFIADNRHSRQKYTFWGLTLLFLCLHLIAFCVLLIHIAQWKLVWFMVMYLELPVLNFVKDRLMGPAE
jgi:peptidoglycan/LPS O-acetylase OafA/YrhL